MTHAHRRTTRLSAIAALALLFATQAHADAITDWNARACDTVVAAQLSPLAANRAMAIVQTAVYDAARAAGGGDRGSASADAAVAAANRVALSRLAPTQQAAIDRAYEAALSAIPDGAAKTQGIALGEHAAAAVLAARAGDDAIAPESWRP